MPIQNYTTEVPPERTAGDITALLIRKSARSVTTDFDDNGQLVGISFVMNVGGIPIQFMLPSNPDGVYKALQRDFPKTKLDTLKKRSRWVAWRILKDWVGAQLALIESNQAEAAQVFMPFAQQNDGRTLYEVFVERNQKRLS